MCERGQERGQEVGRVYLQVETSCSHVKELGVVCVLGENVLSLSIRLVHSSHRQQALNVQHNRLVAPGRVLAHLTQLTQRVCMLALQHNMPTSDK